MVIRKDSESRMVWDMPERHADAGFLWKYGNRLLDTPGQV
jgi:hypothetical protein